MLEKDRVIKALKSLLKDLDYDLYKEFDADGEFPELADQFIDWYEDE